MDDDLVETLRTHNLPLAHDVAGESMHKTNAAVPLHQHPTSAFFIIYVDPFFNVQTLLYVVHKCRWE